MEEKMEVIVDRFEGDYAVVEIAIGKCVNIPRVLVPDAKEGDIIKIEIEKEETEERKKYITSGQTSMKRTCKKPSSTIRDASADLARQKHK